MCEVLGVLSAADTDADTDAASAIAAEDLPLHALNKLPYGKLSGSRIGVKEGIIFLTYSSLIASSGRWIG